MRTTVAQDRVYYRPEWTCGRYNKEHQATIYYNLLEGMSYYFEDYSAQVIGLILSVPRNTSFAVSSLVEATGIEVESIAPFMDQLESLGMIVSQKPTQESIAEYRANIRKCKMDSINNESNAIDDMPLYTTSAEKDYMAKVGGVVSVMFELTYNCSTKCIHCYNLGATRNDNEVSYRNEREELQYEDYIRIIDELYEHGVTKVCLSGGDPFSKPHVWDIIEYLYNKEIAVDIYTNGVALKDKEIRLANYYPHFVGISVYSAIPEVHDAITRVKGSFERTIGVIQNLSLLSIPIALKCCIMRPNFKSYRTVKDLADSFYAETQYEVHLTDSIDGDKCVSRHLRLLPHQYEVVFRDPHIRAYVGPELPNYGGIKKTADIRPCGAGESTFCVTPEGNMIPCCSFHLVLGNLKNNPITSIINDNDVLEQWRNTVVNDMEECGKHDYCDFCVLCAGNNFSEHHSYLRAGENNCYIAKLRYELSLKMKNEGYDPLGGKTIAYKLEQMESAYEGKLKREKA